MADKPSTDPLRDIAAAFNNNRGNKLFPRGQEHYARSLSERQQRKNIPQDDRLQKILLCPHVGTVGRWSDRGYGRFCLAGKSKEYFAHANSCIPPIPKGKRVDGYIDCIAAVAVDGVQFRENMDDRECAIRWVRLDDVGIDKSKYRQERQKILAEISSEQLQKLLRADWYRAKWGGAFQYGMQDDDLLAEAFKRAATLIKKPTKLTALLKLIDESPQAFAQRNRKHWIAKNLSQCLDPLMTISPIAGLDLLRQLNDEWRTPLESVVSEAVAPPVNHAEKNAAEEILSMVAQEARKMLCRRFIESGVDFECSEELLSCLSDEQIKELFCRRAVALDIESNGDVVYQIACHDGGKPLSTPLQPGGLALEDFRTACEGMADQYPGRWLVGHNILAWDLPVICRHAPDSRWAKQRVGIWDTQLVSWCLEPWRRSHALIGAVRAHDASEDALAAFNLFRGQVERLPVEARKLLLQPDWDISTVWSMLVSRKGAESFRSPPQWLVQSVRKGASNTGVLLPLSKLREIEWVPGVQFAWPPGYSDELDRELSAQKLCEYTERYPNDKHLHLIATMVSSAEAAAVCVRIRMIPFWLRKGRESHLDACARRDVAFPAHSPAKWVVSTYEALRESNEETRNEWISQWQHPFPEDAGLGILRKCNEISDSRVATVMGVGADDVLGGVLLRCPRNQNLSGLLGTPCNPSSRYWLEHLPIRESSRRLWHLWELSAAVSVVREHAVKDEDLVPSNEWRCGVPQFIDADSETGPMRDVLWPTSASRYEYWRDTLGRLHSLLATLTADALVVFLMRYPEERELLAQVLCREYDVPDLSANPMDQLRRARTSHLRLILAGSENAVFYSECAELLKIPLTFILDELPFFKWWMADDGSSLDAGGSEADADDCGGDETTGESAAANTTLENLDKSDDDFQAREVLSIDTLQAILCRRLPDWGQTVLNAGPTYVIDPRLDMMPLRKTGCIDRPDVPLLRLPDSLAISLESVRDSLGSLHRKDPPKTVDEYSEFLVTHWNRDRKAGETRIEGFYDFQKPIIRALVESPDADLIVRLPTGAGKSVLFQVPALANGLQTQRLSLILSPLRALMKDQVVKLWQLGFFQSVDYMSGDREPWENAEVLQGIIDHRIKLLYVAPERFRNGRFRDALLRRGREDNGLEFAIIDEAHCVSQWGYEFRPDYFYAADEICRCFRSNGLMSRVMLFSATVTTAVNRELERVFIPPESERRLIASPAEYRHPIQDHIHLSTEEVPQPLYGQDPESRLISRAGEIADVIRKAKPETSIVIVFVTRRRHAIWLRRYLQENLPGEYRVAAFHAGMPANIRAAVYDRVKRSDVNVLVATKAFGMGMDIPNIHWCIHVAPPGYIEDYLQEVGRTGRDKDKLAAAKGKDGKVDCILFHNEDDLKRNTALALGSMIQPHDLVTVWNAIMAGAHSTGSGARICLLTEGAVGNPKGDRLRMALCWLERPPCRRITTLGYLPDCLHVSSINQTALEAATAGDTQEAVVARSILKLINGPEPEPLRNDVETLSAPRGRGFWSAVSNLIGFFFPSNAVEKAPAAAGTSTLPAQAAATAGAADINMGAIFRASAMDSIDDVYRGLNGLHRRKCLVIDRSLHFKAGDNLKHAAQIWNWLELMTNALIRKAESPQNIDFDEMLKSLAAGNDHVVIPREKREWEDRSMACVRAAIRLGNAAGMRIREILDDERRHSYQFSLPDRYVNRVKRRAEQLIRLAKCFVLEIGKSDKGEVNFSEILNVMGDKVRLRDAARMLQLISGLDFYSSSEPLVPFSHILRVDVEDPLLDPLDPGARDADKAMYEDQKRVNRMTELRSFAMRAYIGIDSDRGKRKFIDEYFATESPEELLSLLVRMGTELGEEGKELCEAIRRDAMETEVKKLRDGEEPQQHVACSASWDKNIMVNAGPGAGKTYVLMMRAAHLIREQGLPPNAVLILAFNRAVVHEIRRRINQLFEKLGLGGYATRLQVYTFHAFSLRHMQRETGASLDQHFARFAERCDSEPAFCAEVTTGVKAVLVDEFQDMDDNRMKLLKAITKTAKAGIMVIGDDDQDILRWNRTDKTEAAVHFQAFHEGYSDPQRVILRRNFRSGQKIVEHSQEFLKAHLPEECHRELAEVQLLPTANNMGKGVVRTDLDPTRLSEEIESLRQIQGISTIAVLSYANLDATLNFERLQPHFPGVVLQGAANHQIRVLRHVACWIDICKQYLNERVNEQLTPELRKQLWQALTKSGIPEVSYDSQRPRGYIYIKFLWDTLLRDDKTATLQDHVDQLMDMDVESYGRLLFQTEIPEWISQRTEQWGGEHRIVVSTIHKVKGLEFDAVVIMPSTAGYRPQDGYKDIADQVRLYYVGMTRAKSHLIYSLGPRENAWLNGESYSAPSGEAMLAGSLDEVKIGFPALASLDVQSYIHSNVAPGEGVKICLSAAGKILIKHGPHNKLIAMLTDDWNTKVKVNTASLKVHSVIRHEIVDEDKEKFKVSDMLPAVQAKKWYYTTTFEGRVS